MHINKNYCFISVWRSHSPVEGQVNQLKQQYVMILCYLNPGSLAIIIDWVALTACVSSKSWSRSHRKGPWPVHLYVGLKLGVGWRLIYYRVDNIKIVFTSNSLCMFALSNWVTIHWETLHQPPLCRKNWAIPVNRCTPPRRSKSWSTQQESLIIRL